MTRRAVNVRPSSIAYHSTLGSVSNTCIAEAHAHTSLTGQMVRRLSFTLHSDRAARSHNHMHGQIGLYSSAVEGV